jgi:NAD-dependent dihydropyrimidine dehydrogenase PreA subunit
MPPQPVNRVCPVFMSVWPGLSSYLFQGEVSLKIIRKIIEIDEEKCTGCGACVVACAEGAIEIIDGVAKVIADRYCDGLGACMGDCPEDALKIVEREADEFDEAAVEAFLKEKKAAGCPSSDIQILDAPVSESESCGCGCGCGGHGDSAASKMPSALGHWPVQIHLISPDAPFLKGADLLIAADCVPVACPDFHADYLKGRAVMIGCPKFDDKEAYVEKLSQVFKAARPRRVTAMIMDVPCCSALPVIVQKALEKAGAEIPAALITINAKGEVIPDHRL